MTNFEWNDLTYQDFPVLETERMILRAPRVADGPVLLPIYSDPEVMAYTGRSPLERMEEMEQWLSMLARGYCEDKGIRWHMVFKENGELIGDLGFHHYEPAYFLCELGYRLSKHYWRQGLMSEALRAVLAHGFSRMDFNRIQALVDVRNQRSAGFLLRNGFTLEGVLRDYEYNHGVFEDLIMFSMLKREWETPPQPASRPEEGQPV